jgi:hypothetical protein
MDGHRHCHLLLLMLGSTGDNPLCLPWSVHVRYNTGYAMLPQIPDILGDIIQAGGHRYQHYSLLSLLATVGSTNNPKDSGEFYPFPTDIYSDNLISELSNIEHSTVRPLLGLCSWNCHTALYSFKYTSFISCL